MSRRRMPGRAARNALPESARGSRTQPERQRARKSRKFTYADDSDSSPSIDSSEEQGSQLSEDQSIHSYQASPPDNLSRGSSTSRVRPRGKPLLPRVTRSRASATAEKMARSPKRRRVEQGIGRPRRANARPKESTWSKRLPPWPPGLPYDVLLSIFQYAAYPLWDEHFNPGPSRTWLTSVALLRKDFTEPALAALYFSPPLFPPTSAQLMIQRLRDPTSSIEYRSKVKYLDVNVSGTLLRKYAGQSPINLLDLVVVCPQLRGIRFHHIADNPRLKTEIEGRVEITKLRTIYAKELFDAIDTEDCLLRTWKWNFFPNLSTEQPWGSLSLIHSRPSFRKLRSLELCHYDNAIVQHRARVADEEPPISQALGMLSELDSITLSRCDLGGPLSFLDYIPPLKTLSLIDCTRISSEELEAFLETHGGQLEQLILLNNAQINLDFTSTLAVNCPSLRCLDVDMTFYSSTLTAPVQSPLFDALLANGRTPTWPSSLSRISMLQLRKWDSESAEPFFVSLQQAGQGGDLPNLRSLTVKASLEGDWRDRIRFRDKWTKHLSDTFMRKIPAPKRHHVPQREQATATTPEVKARKEARSKLRSRGFTPPEDCERPQGGTCSIVEVRIDNLRPMDVQFNESNFMDDERSGDEDWDGQEGGNDDRYAW